MKPWNGGPILRALRLGVGHSSQHIAAAVEVNTSYVWRLERGERRPSLATLGKWCAMCPYEKLEPRALAQQLDALGAEPAAGGDTCPNADLDVAHSLVAYADLMGDPKDVVPTLLDALRPITSASAHGTDLTLYQEMETQAGLVWLAITATRQAQPYEKTADQLTELRAVVRKAFNWAGVHGAPPDADWQEGRVVIDWWAGMVATAKRLPRVNSQAPDPLQARLEWLWGQMGETDQALIVGLAERLVRGMAND